MMMNKKAPTTITMVVLVATALPTNAFAPRQPSSHGKVTTARYASTLGVETLLPQENAHSSSVHPDATTPSLGTSSANHDTTTLGTLKVPTVGIGTISWSSEHPFKLENKQLQSIVDTACHSNAAFFDTAERYGSHFKTALGMGWGETESLTSQMLRHAAASGNDVDKNGSPAGAADAVLATKFTPSPWRTTVDSVVEACEESRKRLGVDQIDLYQLHMPDIVQPFRFLGQEQVKDEIYWDGLAECYHRGLVKNVGVCNYGPTLLTKCQQALEKRGVPLASNQIAYSLIGRHNGAQETVDKCDELGIRVLGFFPFAMGLLTGKYSEYTTDQNNKERDHQHALLTKKASSLLEQTNKKTTLEKMDLHRYARGDGGKSIPAGGIDPLMQVMQTIAEQRGKTIAQIALNYVICKGVIPIPGANTKQQVVDNLGAMGWRLTDEEVQLLETTADSLGFGFDGAGFKRTSEKFVGYGIEKFSLV